MIRRRRLLISMLLIVIILAVGLVIIRAQRQYSSANTIDTAWSADSSSTHTLDMPDGGQRVYRVHTPTGYDNTRTYTVVLGLHGGFGNAEQFEKASHLSELADTKGFIAVYGQGTSLGAINAPTWNAGGCCGSSSKNGVNDVSYVRTVIKKVQEDYSVDSNRVYVTGMSNGGMMTNRLACEAADMFTGAAIVSGTIQIGTCAPSRPIPILIMHGTDDDNVPYAGGQGSKAFNQSTYIPVEQEFAEWSMRNGCGNNVSTTAMQVQSDDGITVDRLTAQGCRQPTLLYRINGGGHEWPSGSQVGNVLERNTPTKAIDASRTILEFFGI